MSEPIQTPIQAQALADFFQVKGGLTLQLDDTVVPVVILGGGNPLAQEGAGEPAGGLIGDSASGAVNQAAVAGSLGHVQLFNPASSGRFLHLHFLSHSLGLPNAAGQSSVGILDTPATTPTAFGARFSDRRVSGEPVGQLLSDASVGPPFSGADVIGLIRAGNDVANDPFNRTFSLTRWVLLEGQGFAVVGPNANQTVDAWWMWGESPL